MNTSIKSIHLLLLFLLFSISLLYAQESPGDSIALIKQNYINAIINETCYAAIYQKDDDLKLPNGEMLYMSQPGML